MRSYIIKKGKHACKWSWWYKIIYIWFFKKEFNFKFSLSNEAWHSKKEINGKDGISKIVGWTFPIHAEKPFGKWWLTKWLVNSIIIGYKANYNINNSFKLYTIDNNRGIEKRVFLFNIDANNIVRGKIKKMDYGIIIYFDYINNVCIEKSYYYRMNLSWFGYRISPYFGSISKAIRRFNVKLDTW